MEEMITAISTRFIGVSSEKLDGEIENALNMIGEFTGVVNSYVRIMSNEKTGEDRQYSAVAAAALMADRVGQVDGIILLNASVLAAVVFAQVYREPAWLEPVSIITSR
jgi:hypothetical protein